MPTQLNTKKIVEANNSYLSGYGAISTVIRQVQAAKLDISDIEKLFNDAIAVIEDKTEVERLDKAYQAASRRILGSAFGFKWDGDEEKGYFHIPASRNTGPKDEFMSKVMSYKQSSARNDKNDAMIMRLIDTIMSEADPS